MLTEQSDAIQLGHSYSRVLGVGDCCSAKWLCLSWNAVETFVNMKCLWFYFSIKINAK